MTSCKAGGRSPLARVLALSGWLLAGLLVAGLAACGGGGGGTDPATPPSVPVAPVAPVAPAVQAQPADTQVTAGSAAVFSVTASGSGLGYQWQRSNDSGATWAAIAGATGAGYTLTSTSVADNASRFRVLVSSGTAQTLSSAATLTVSALVAAPAITVQPQPAQATAGGSASFAVTATGTALVYRWQRSANGTDWSDAPAGDGPTLTLTSLALASDQLQLRVLVSNSASSITSSTARLTVLPVPPAAAAPSFTTQPAAASVVAPATASFTVTVSGTPAPTLQWQRSSDGGISYSNIAGATGTSYGTAATSVADHDTRYRVEARNASGTVTSEAALLSVTSAGVAPTIQLGPLAEVVATAGQQASFVVFARGTPTPSYQWQFSADGGSSFANINGATAEIYSFVSTLADDGRRYRVVVSNSLGTVTSPSALLIVRPAPATGSSGRAWTAGQALESGDGAVANVLPNTTIDDLGRTTVVFGKHDGTRMAVHAVRSIPGAAGVAPSVGTAVVLDALVPYDTSFTPWLATSPGGNLLAAWVRRAPCSATTYSTVLTCSYLIVARFLQSTGNWETPLLLADVPTPSLTLRINDAGDIAVLHPAWSRQPGGALRHGTALSWMAHGQNTWQRFTAFPEAGPASFSAVDVALDAAGNFVLVGTGQPASSSNNDAVAYRGQVSGTAVGNREVLDSLASAATVHAVWAAPGGQVAVAWQQLGPSGARATTFIGTLDSAAGAWQVRDTAINLAVGRLAPATLSADGQFIWHLLASCQTLRRAAGAWQADAAMPPEACGRWVNGNTLVAMARNGDLLMVDADAFNNTGRWLLYDDARRQVIDTFATGTAAAGYVLGVSVLPAGVPLLAPGGVGAYVSVNVYDTVPAAGAISGTTRGINSLWAWTLK